MATGLNERQLEQWHEDRERVAAQHPHWGGRGRGVRWSRGDHYRRKNNGIALRTYRTIRDSRRIA